jgi:hypothetical protein
LSRIRPCRFGPHHRGVVATAAIGAGEIILQIPRNLLITQELACQSGRIASQIAELNLDGDAFMAVFLLEIRASGETSSDPSQVGFWKPYVNALPKSYDFIPLFWPNSRFEEATGSLLPSLVSERRRKIKEDYDQICAKSPAFEAFSLVDFMWARTAVASRQFLVNIHGKATAVLVPVADLLNHKIPSLCRLDLERLRTGLAKGRVPPSRPPRSTTWSFDDALDSFTIVTDEPHILGAEVFDSYGKKDNAALLHTYGFVETDPAHALSFAAVLIKCTGPENGLKARKVAKLGRNFGVFRLSKDLSHVNTRKALGFLRVMHARGYEVVFCIHISDKRKTQIGLTNYARSGILDLVKNKIDFFLYKMHKLLLFLSNTCPIAI